MHRPALRGFGGPRRGHAMAQSSPLTMRPPYDDDGHFPDRSSHRPADHPIARSAKQRRAARPGTGSRRCARDDGSPVPERRPPRRHRLRRHRRCGPATRHDVTVDHPPSLRAKRSNPGRPDPALDRVAVLAIRNPVPKRRPPRRHRIRRHRRCGPATRHDVAADHPPPLRAERSHPGRPGQDINRVATLAVTYRSHTSASPGNAIEPDHH